MNLGQAIYDVYEILRAHSKDKDFNEEYIAHKLSQYRAVAIANRYSQHGYLSQLWFQNHKPIELTKITSGDDPLITLGSITMGKGTVATPIYLEGDYLPLVVTGPSRQFPYSITEPETLFNRIISGEYFHPNYGYFFIRGTDLYTYPYTERVSPNGIFDNPVEIEIYDPVTETYVLPGLEDPYPMDMSMAQEIIISLLTKEYGITMQQISDMLNDGVSKLNVLPSEPTR